MSAEKIPMTTEKVYSPIFDKDIRKNVNGSPIWKKAYHADEIVGKKGPITEYIIKFEGTTPVQVKSFKNFKK